ncbi:MAG: 30S ribosomal protein S9 [Streptosporangiales bacterium]|nr:30S ribosomal protein S9 [Streptosporangiales bacterium]
MAEPTGVETPAPDTETEYGQGAPGQEAPAEGVSVEYSTETPAVEVPEEAPPPVTGPTAGTGRRKEAVARVRLIPGSGKWQVNGQPLSSHFPNRVHQQLINEPFVALGVEERFDVFARVRGGGPSGQAGALRLGIARALGELDPEFRPSLKKAGFLTRDARVKERRKYGLKKARKAPQYSKR